jgi:hypothetical protein
MQHIEKLGAFTDRSYGLQGPLLAAACAVARELGARATIYLPDSSSPLEVVFDWVLAGLSDEEILDRLRAQFGPPAASPDDVGAESYFIDSVTAG